MAKIEITLKDNEGNITGKKEYDLELGSETLDDIEEAVEKLKNRFLRHVGGKVLDFSRGMKADCVLEQDDCHSNFFLFFII
jgi:hypothetical protein